MPKIFNKPEINHSNKIKSPTEKIRQIKNLSFKQQKSHHIFFQCDDFFFDLFFNFDFCFEIISKTKDLFFCCFSD